VVVGNRIRIYDKETELDYTDIDNPLPAGRVGVGVCYGPPETVYSSTFDNFSICPLDSHSYLFEEFIDNSFDTRLATHDMSNTTWKLDGWFLVMEQGDWPDAGIVQLKEAVDVSRPLLFKTRAIAHHFGGGGNSHCSLLDVSLSNDTNLLNGTEHIIRSRIFVDGYLHLEYQNSLGQWMGWDHATGAWVADAAAADYDSNGGGTFVTELHSDGTSWYLIVRSEYKDFVAKTAPVLWSQTRSNGEDHRLSLGQFDNTAYFNNMHIDYFHVIYEPN
jgi:hypothetical protein